MQKLGVWCNTFYPSTIVEVDQRIPTTFVWEIEVQLFVDCLTKIKTQG